MKSLQTIVAATLFVAFSSAWAQAPFVFAVNEGVTYRVNPGATADRFKDLGDDLSKLLKRPVKIQPVADYKELAAGLDEQRYDMAYVHPAHHAIRAMAKNDYKLVAVTKGFTEYRASFLVPADSTLKSVAELKKVGAPDEDSITSVIMRATLKEAGVAPAISYVRMQEAVPFMVENRMVGSGVTASKAVVKEWQDKGGKVLLSSKPVPIKQLIASAKLPEAQRAQLISYFTTLESTPEGKKRLEALNVGGFLEYDQNALAGIGKWLGV